MMNILITNTDTGTTRIEETKGSGDAAYIKCGSTRKPVSQLPYERKGMRYEVFDNTLYEKHAWLFGYFIRIIFCTDLLLGDDETGIMFNRFANYLRGIGLPMFAISDADKEKYGIEADDDNYYSVQYLNTIRGEHSALFIQLEEAGIIKMQVFAGLE